ncbi:MAG: ribonuclease HII [Candidatus Latescibacteria bacterium]|nr:ribonuclease HII [Candidatus Latescibacterota bacterium]
MKDEVGRVSADPDLSRMSVAQIRVWAAGRMDEAALALLEADPRAGVQALACAIRRQVGRAEQERARLGRMLEIERRLRAQGAGYIAGVDEAGRGPLAGPVVAAAVVLPTDPDLPGLDDSKKLTPARRDALFDCIRAQAVAVGVGMADSAEIDRLNILQATLKAMREALSALAVTPDRVLIDGNQRPGSGLPELAFVDGDARSLSIAAASVIAKVTRDRMMADYDRLYPGYGFGGHKGYGSAQHLQALRDLGPSPIHRRSFAPVGERGGGPGPERDGRHRTGRQGEEMAVALLEQKGYAVLDRNFRGGGGEIDVVAVRGDVIAFVEVKTDRAGGFGGPALRVDEEKQRRMAQAAEMYLHLRGSGGLAPRFDVITIELKGEGFAADHIEGAFLRR